MKNICQFFFSEFSFFKINRLACFFVKQLLTVFFFFVA